MRTLTSKEAEEIATKLNAEIQEGRGHKRVLIRWQGRVVASYGIRRGSRETSHDYIPRQIFLTFRETLDLARCPLSSSQYFELLRSRGRLP
jgi:hypothetical protein